MDFKYIYNLVWEAEIQKEKQRQRARRELVHLPGHSSVNQRPEMDWSEVRRQEPPSDLACGPRYQKTWAVFHCFPKPLAMNWLKSAATEISTGACMGCWCGNCMLSLLCQSTSSQ